MGRVIILPTYETKVQKCFFDRILSKSQKKEEFMSKKRKISAVIGAILAFVAALGTVGCGEKPTAKVKLYFDGGGGSGNYNTTRNYDTLETLASEWNAKNDKFEVVINAKSLNGNRGSIISMLSAGTAPDMLTQVGGVANDDIGNRWYEPLNDYLEKPNPYESGNERWKDIYGADAIAAAQAADGVNYYVCLDNIAIGMMYNMDILAKAGVSKAPETHSEFIECLEKLKMAKSEGKITAEIYCQSGLWHESFIGNSVYGAKIAAWDIDNNGMVSSYELIKAYKEEQWSLDDDRFNEFLRLCYEKAEYYPSQYLGYDVSYQFAKGNLAIMDAIGNSMATLSKNAKFNLKITGYPALDAEASAFGGYATRRGCAGLSSAYWVTNSAINKGQDAVDACVDFLMFLTASENNKRLVNDLGTALPINIKNSNVGIFADLAKQYESDLSDPNSLMWSSCYIPESLGTQFNEKYQLAMGKFYQDSEGKLTGNVAAVTAALNEELGKSIDSLCSKYGWTFE